MTRKLSYLAILALVLAAGTAVAGDYEEYFDQTYQMIETGSVGLENINGDLTIEVWDRAEVRVQAEKRASSEKLLQELKIEVDASKSAVRIDTGYPNTRGFFKPDVRTFLKRWVAEGPTHHFALGVGHHAETIKKIGELLDIESVIV